MIVAKLGGVEVGLMLSNVLVGRGLEGGVWTMGSSLLSNDPLLAGNCCLGLCSSLCAFQEPAVMIKVVLNLAIP